MGAGYAIGAQTVPICVFSAREGGPLASIRPEEAGPLQILREVAANYDSQPPLLIFVDCLVLLDILPDSCGSGDVMTFTRIQKM